MTQSNSDKIKIAGWADDGGKNHALLQATCGPADEILAKNILMTLYRVKPIQWDVEFQDDVIAFWCGLHPTYGYRLRFTELNKGLSVIRKRGQELVDRIEGGACQ